MLPKCTGNGRKEVSQQRKERYFLEHCAISYTGDDFVSFTRYIIHCSLLYNIYTCIWYESFCTVSRFGNTDSLKRMNHDLGSTGDRSKFSNIHLPCCRKGNIYTVNYMQYISTREKRIDYQQA